MIIATRAEKNAVRAFASPTRSHRDIRKIKISAEKAGNRAERLEVFEFDEEPEAVAQPMASALEGPG